jgi:DNA-binding NtrC family response regulator
MDSAKLVMVVDDDPEIREMLRDALEQEGYRVLLIESGSGLFGIIANEVPDLIILDLLLPGEHGLDLVAMVKKKFFIPTLIISGIYKIDEIRAQLETTMVEGFLEKPIDLPNLRSAVKQLIG